MSSSHPEYVEDEAFLLRSTSYGDHHRILSFLTAGQGRIDAIAHAAQKSRKRFSGGLDFINCLKICLKPKSPNQLAHLVSCDLQEGYDEVRGSYSASIVALEWIRLLSRAVPHHQNIPGVYPLLKASLERLGSENYRGVDLEFRLKLLEFLGYRLQLARCARCARERGESFFFYPEEGGLLCESCAPDSRRAPLTSLPVSEGLSGSEGYSEVRGLLDESFLYYLDVKPSSKEYRHFS